jgi:hypothetical protein
LIISTSDNPAYKLVPIPLQLHAEISSLLNLVHSHAVSDADESLYIKNTCRVLTKVLTLPLYINDPNTPNQLNKAGRTIENVRTDLEDANASVQYLQNRATDLQTQVEQGLAIGASTAMALEKAELQLRNNLTQLPTITESSCLTAKHPDPPLCFSKNPKQLSLFLTQLLIILLHNVDHYPNDQAYLRYAMSRLEGVALAQILPKVTKTTFHLGSLVRLIQVLENAFHDPDKEATAERELTKLYQREREFSQYDEDFQQMIADLEYNESV